MSAPIILTGTTDGGRKFVQFWAENTRVHGVPVGALNVAEMNASPPTVGGFPLLRIHDLIDPAWIDVVLAVFDAFRKGGVITPTHTVAWDFGHAVFTPIAAAPVTDAPLELDIEVLP